MAQNILSRASNAISIIALTLILTAGASVAEAQLPEDVRDVFAGLLEDLDDDLAEKFKSAIKNNTATVEFTPDQFRRFRDDPINPFEGLEGVDAGDDVGIIALKFELPSLRNRLVHPQERQHESLLKQLQPAVRSASESTVQIFNDRKQVALGIVVGSEGEILTKASEVENEENIICRLPDGQRLPARIVHFDSASDIALLAVEAKGLTPVSWSDAQPQLGAFVITPDCNGEVLGLGTYSAPARSTAAGEQAFLGVQPQTTTDGVVVRVDEGTASDKAGLRTGDVIFKLAGSEIHDVSDLVRQIRSRRPGDSVAIEYLRNGVKQVARAILTGRNISGDRAARFKMMNRLGAILSRRNDGFPNVLQHDTPLFPEQCGGPICDLQGNVIGMNIARNGRAASYAVPAAHVQTVLAELKHSSVAHNGDSLSDQSAPKIAK